MADRKIRPIRVEGNVAYIQLTRGFEAVIDASDVPLVEGRNWYAAPNCGTVYAITKIRRGKTMVTAYLHREISKTPAGLCADHIDGDGLNNRRDNLRAATKSENMHNSGRKAANTSGYKGVGWCRRLGRWRARIRTSSGRKYLGSYDTREAAYAAYCDAAERIHGEFARLE